MYRETVDKDTSLVLSADAELFRFLRSAGTAPPASKAPRAPAPTAAKAARASTTVTQQP
jgi:hypothetical protein